MSLAAWYHNQYSTWNRTRRLQQSPYIAQPDTNVSRTATEMAQNGTAVGLNMRNLTDGSPTVPTKEKKGQDSLFGPNIGVVSGGPAWTDIPEKKVLADELTPEVVRGWIEKSKEASQPTTTLQALVNLKRPTLRLSPLDLTPSDPSDEHPDLAHHLHHGLEFEFDCDAPKCGIYVHVLLPPEHPEAAPGSSTSSSGLTKVLVFETVVEGGFGKMLKLEEGAMLELGRFESDPCGNARDTSTSIDGAGASGSAATATPASDSTGNVRNGNGNPNADRRRRFTSTFHFRKRSHNRSVSGPALAVLDAEPPTTAAVAGSAIPESKVKSDTKEEKEGVRVTIRLAALDEQGTELSSPNEQVTYLHVVRFGARAAEDGGATAGEDTRPWVVKVVKREATIGPHTFHLHEIFGLSSSSTTTSAPTAPLPITASPPASPSSPSHTYPPSTTSAPTLTPAPVQADDEPSSECLLCLSSPREVVLLPCRHLVACKECALNMVEFGAGGVITQAEEAVGGAASSGGTAAADASGGAEGGANSGGEGETAGAATTPTPAVATTPAPPANPRRKRKAKGWFCPVCRQPYTSLLRITTTPPPPGTDKEEGQVGTADITDPAAAAGGTGTRPVFPFRPSFLRTFSRAVPGDVESQTGAVRA